MARFGVARAQLRARATAFWDDDRLPLRDTFQQKGLPMPTATDTLAFYDHFRQSYGHLPIDDAAEFMLGDYGDGNNGVGKGGEFKVSLIALQSGWRGDRELTPHLHVFGDALGSLERALAMGLGGLLEKTYRTADAFSEALIDAGFRDLSAHPIGHKPVCSCCGEPVRSKALFDERKTDD